MYPKYNLLHYTYTVPRKCYRGRHSEVLITITVTPIIAVMLGNAWCLCWVMLTSDARYNAAYDTQQEHLPPIMTHKHGRWRLCTPLYVAVVLCRSSLHISPHVHAGNEPTRSFTVPGEGHYLGKS